MGLGGGGTEGAGLVGGLQAEVEGGFLGWIRGVHVSRGVWGLPCLNPAAWAGVSGCDSTGLRTYICMLPFCSVFAVM